MSGSRLVRAGTRALESTFSNMLGDVNDVGREETKVRTECGLEEGLVIRLTSCCVVVVEVVEASGARVGVETMGSHSAEHSHSVAPPAEEEKSSWG